MDRILIAPSILSADFSRMGEEIKSLEECGADVIHCDVMDGIFVPNITFGIKMIEDIRKVTNLPLDVHLMIDRPERYVEAFMKAGSDYVSIHHEATDKLEETLKFIRDYGKKPGIVINPQTAVEVIGEAIGLCDIVTIMGVQPGFGGQKYIDGTTQKIVKTRELIKKTGRDILLEVDGGVTLDNVGEIKCAGANVIVAGSTVFSAEDRSESIRKLKELL